MLITADFLRSKFDDALSFEDFVSLGEDEGYHLPWRQRYDQLTLSAEQSALIGGFTRSMKVLCLTGIWCGDCALQGAAMQRIAEANPQCIDLRFLLRVDEHADLIIPSQINAGFRVPVTWFMAEEFEPVSRFGDRTLSRYRSMARKQLPEGAVAIIEPPPADPVRTVLNEVLDEFERVQLLLRMSPRLREKHGD